MQEILDEADIPRFARGVRLVRDEPRDRWVVLAPERILTPDAIAVEVLRRVDGSKTLSGIIEDLAGVFTADRMQIGRDVQTFLADLAEKGFIEVQ